MLIKSCCFFSTVRPDFSFNLLDQFLVLIEKAQIKPIIIISKIDLIEAKELNELKTLLHYYETIGYELYYVNSKQKVGFDILENVF